jgi:cytochrome c553
MKELGISLLCCSAIIVFFAAEVYSNLEYTGYSRKQSCTDECYAEYVATNGTVVEVEQRKTALANLDEFSSIRSLWGGCAACHGADGSGGVGPKLAEQTADYISGRLVAYKNKERVGSQSALMWGQAAILSDKDISVIGDYIAAGLPSN